MRGGRDAVPAGPDRPPARRGDPFTAGNVRLPRQLGVTVFAGGFAADVVEELAFRALAGPIVDGPVGGFVWSGWWLVGVVFLTIAGGHQPRHEPDRALRPGGRHAGQPFRFLKNGRARAIRFSTLTALCERSRNVFKYDFTFVGSRVRVFADIRTRCGGDDVPRTVYVGAINTTQ